MNEDTFYLADYQHVSLMEYPGKISSIIFTLGCSLRCRYCHNPDLVLGRKGVGRLDEFLKFLDGKDIEAVAVTGGEPLLSPHLADFLWDMKNRGLSVKLDTNGFHPDRLDRLCKEGLVDLAAVDLKAFGQESLKKITRADVKLESFYRTLDVLKDNQVDFEVRHTLWEVPDVDDVDIFAEKAPDAVFYMQKVREAKMLDKTFSVAMLDVEKAENILRERIRYFNVRG